MIRKNWRIRTRNLTHGHILPQVIFHSTHEEARKIALADNPNSEILSVEPGGDETHYDLDWGVTHINRPDFRKAWEQVPPLP